MDVRTELHSLFARGIELLGQLETAPVSRPLDRPRLTARKSARQPAISFDDQGLGQSTETGELPLDQLTGERIRGPPPDEPLIVRPLSRAFAMVGVAKTRGYEMLNEGTLERVKLGKRASGVTMRSIRRLQEGRG